MIFYLLTFSFPEWRPNFAFLDTAHANEMMALRWLHLIFGIIWIGLLYFFNLVLTPAMKKCDPQLRIKIYPQLMPGAMGWFRSSALVTVLVGMRYFSIHLAADAKLAGDRSLTGKWFGWWLLVWLAAYVFIYALQLPAKGILDRAWVRVIGISVVVGAASWLVLALNGGPNVKRAPGHQRGRGTRFHHAAEHLGSHLAGAEASHGLGAHQRRTRCADAAGSRAADALELSHRAHLVLAVLPHAFLHGRRRPLPVPEYHRAIRIVRGFYA